MSSNNNQPINKFYEHAKSIVNKKVHKYAYHCKEILIDKRGELDKNLMEHVPYFKKNYIEKFCNNPLYFVRLKQDFRDYAKRETKECQQEFENRKKLAKERFNMFVNSEFYPITKYCFFSFIFLLYLVKKL